MSILRPAQSTPASFENNARWIYSALNASLDSVLDKTFPEPPRTELGELGFEAKHSPSCSVNPSSGGLIQKTRPSQMCGGSWSHCTRAERERDMQCVRDDEVAI